MKITVGDGKVVGWVKYRTYHDQWRESRDIINMPIKMRSMITSRTTDPWYTIRDLIVKEFESEYHR